MVSSGRIGALGTLTLSMALGGCSVVGYPSPAAVGADAVGPAAPRDVAAREGADGADDDFGEPVIAREPASRSGNPDSYEQFGRRYEVLDSADAYEETGLASWYGREFAGRPTASGEIFDPDLLTAAHRTLPLPSWVEVENLENGRRVVVRVNDRGPFADPDRRIIDVSRAAAERLGMRSAGVAPVRIRVLAAPRRSG